MQKHEGPRRDHRAEERYRQWIITKWLLLVILMLGGLLVAMLYGRWM